MSSEDSFEKTRPIADSSGQDSGQRRSIFLEPFRAGEQLAGRFEIVELLGSGGMGEVYEATDRVLQEQVAIKVVHPRTATSEDSLLRLRREVQLARKVTHPNICRVFDLFRHRVSYGLEIDLVSMELLRGESLRQALERDGAMDAGKAVELTCQMARGLQAAHRLGIVHRDLKPSNIMLVEERDGLRVAITDFGLARYYTQTAEEADLTGSGVMLGTPTYISPEQVQGLDASAATDIYSLGVILYEMLSGVVPFSGVTPIQLALERLVSSPRPLQELMPGLDPELLALVDRCLAVDPEKRPSDALELLEILEGEASGSSTLERDTRKARVTRGSRESGDPESTLVMPETVVSASLAAELATKGRRKGWLTALAVASVMVAALFLVGWALREPSAENAFGAAAAPPPAGPLEERVAELLDGQLRTMESASFAPAAVESADPAAIRVADNHLALFDGASALERIEAALVEHPGDAFLLARKAEALWRLGRDGDALEIAERAVAASGGLQMAKPLRIDCLYYGLNGDWAKARENLLARLAERGLDLDSGLWAIEVNWFLGQNDPMDELFTKLRELPGSASDVRIDLWESRVAHSQGDYERQERFVRSVIARSGDRTQRFLQLEGYLGLVEALGRLGRLQEAEEELAKVEELVGESGSHLYLAHSIRAKGRLLKRQGRSAEAIARLREAAITYEELGSLWGQCNTLKLLGKSSTIRLIRNPSSALEAGIQGFERGVEVCRRGGFHEKEALVMLNLARAKRDRGDFEEAILLFQESAHQLGKLGNHRHQAMTRLGLALLLGRLGRTDEMLDALEASEAWQRQLSDTEELVKILEVRAWGLISAGRLEESKRLLVEVQQHPVTPSRRLDLLELRGEIAWAEADGPTLERLADELGALARQLGREEMIGISQRLAAKAAILEGRLGQGLDQLGELDTARAALVRAEMLWRFGRSTESLAELEQSRKAIIGLEERFKDWRLEILDHLLRAGVTLDRGTALDDLRAIEHAAVRKGHIHAAIRARLAIGVLTEDEEMLRAVEAECRRHGFLLLAQIAREA